jgi:hypothetical protein
MTGSVIVRWLNPSQCSCGVPSRSGAPLHRTLSGQVQVTWSVATCWRHALLYGLERIGMLVTGDSEATYYGDAALEWRPWYWGRSGVRRWARRNKVTVP